MSDIFKFRSDLQVWSVVEAEAPGSMNPIQLCFSHFLRKLYWFGLGHVMIMLPKWIEKLNQSKLAKYRSISTALFEVFWNVTGRCNIHGIAIGPVSLDQVWECLTPTKQDAEVTDSAAAVLAAAVPLVAGHPTSLHKNVASHKRMPKKHKNITKAYL